MDNFWTILIFLIAIVLTKIIFYVATIQTKSIIVKKKYCLNTKGTQIFKIYDGQIEYFLTTDILISTQKCSRIWEHIKEGHEYKIKYYGLNLPYLSMHYKIIGLQSLNVEN